MSTRVEPSVLLPPLYSKTAVVPAGIGPYLETASDAYGKRAVVAIDFGSTHSGFAYALTDGLFDEEEKGYGHHDDYGLGRSGHALSLSPSDEGSNEHSTLNSNMTLEHPSLLGEDPLPAPKHVAGKPGFEPQIIAPLFRGKFYKQPTSILLDRETHEPILFGFEAQEEYRQLLLDHDTETLSKCLFFNGSNIKMRLWKHGQFTEHIPCTTVDSKDTLPLLDVIAGVLKCLMRSSLEMLSVGSEFAVPASDVLWVITVPAIWQEADKQFMRRSAHRAGIVPSPESSDLVLALEPECASIAVYMDTLTPMPLSVRDKILTLDCGGGTTDVACVQVVSGVANDMLRFRQLLEPSGGNWGATSVDWTFGRFLGRLIRDAALLRMRKEHPRAAMELTSLWNTFKCSLEIEDFDPSSGDKTLNLAPMINAMNESKQVVDLGKLVDRYNATAPPEHQVRAKGRKGSATMLVMPTALLLSFFNPTVNRILEHVKELFALDILSDLKYLVLVGGFGESPLLKTRLGALVKKLAPHSSLVFPSRTSSATLVGAVKFGLQPAVIQTRRARMTIGVKVTVPLSRVRDPENEAHRKNMFYDQDVIYVRNVFQPFVTRGQEVSATEKAKHYFGAVRPEWTTVKFEIYATTKSNTLHTTERGCTRLAKIVIDTVDPFNDAAAGGSDGSVSDADTQIRKSEIVTKIEEDDASADDHSQASSSDSVQAEPSTHLSRTSLKYGTLEKKAQSGGDIIYHGLATEDEDGEPVHTKHHMGQRHTGHKPSMSSSVSTRPSKVSVRPRRHRLRFWKNRRKSRTGRTQSQFSLISGDGGSLTCVLPPQQESPKLSQCVSSMSDMDDFVADAAEAAMQEETENGPNEESEDILDTVGDAVDTSRRTNTRSRALTSSTKSFVRVPSAKAAARPARPHRLMCSMSFAATEITAEVLDIDSGRKSRLLLQYDNMGLKAAKGTKGTFVSVAIEPEESGSTFNLDFIDFNFDDGTSGFI